jgi:hypothetical protein
LGTPLFGLLKLPASPVFCTGIRFNGIPPPSKGSLSETGDPKFKGLVGAWGVTAFGGGAALLLPGSGLKNRILTPHHKT